MGSYQCCACKCQVSWKSASNAQGSRLIIVALQVGAVMEALRKMIDRLKLSLPQELRSLHPWMLMFFFESPQVKITFVILLCIYIVLQSHVKAYKYIYIYIFLSAYVKLYLFLHLHKCNKFYTLARSINKFHYGIYTYTECKYQTIYMHNTGSYMCCLKVWGI